MPPAAFVPGLPLLSARPITTAGLESMSGKSRLDPAFNLDRPVPDERSGISGFCAAGAVLQSSQVEGRYSKLGALGQAMSVLDSRLRGQLADQTEMNEAVMRSFKADAFPAAVAGISSAGGAASSPRAASGSPGAPLLRRSHSSTLTAVGRTLSASAGGAGRPASLGDAMGARVVGEPRWGVSEGGRDQLPWVRSLVKYTELHPVVLQTEECSSESVPDGLGFRKTVFPSLKPNRREDVLLLQSWLEETIKMVGTAGGAAAMPGTADAPATPVELADGALHVYNVAWDELKKQVSSECRERGELMHALWDHYWALVELRTGLHTERRVAETQALFGGLLADRERLGADVIVLEESLVESDREQRTAQQQAARAASGLSQKLLEAQRAASEISNKWKVTDLTLQHEVNRRLVTDQALSNTQELLNRTEHEWLKHRDQNLALEAEAQAQREQVTDLQKRLDDLGVANQAVQAQHAAALEAKAALELQLLRMKHEVDTDEILVVGQRQQIRELEQQLALLKLALRDQTAKIDGAGAAIELVQNDKDRLLAQHASDEKCREALEQQLRDTDAQLVQVTVALERTKAAEEAVAAKLAAEEARAREVEGTLGQEVARLTTQVRDTSHNLKLASLRHQELATELASLKEHLMALARVLEAQGMPSQPKPGDKAWEVSGPVGAAQRVASAAQRHVMAIFEQLEAARREVAVLNERAKGEAEMQTMMQAELLAARTAEGAMMRDKNQLEARFSQVERQCGIFEGQLLRAQSQLQTEAVLTKQRLDELYRLRADVARLAPLEQLCHQLTPQVADLMSKVGILQEAQADARAALAEQARELDISKAELQKATDSSGKLIEQVRALNVVASETDDLHRVNKLLRQEVEQLQAQLDGCSEAHGDTIKQLELAKFFLQGIDKDAAVSTVSPPRTNAVKFAPSTSMSYRPQSGGGVSRRPGALSGGASSMSVSSFDGSTKVDGSRQSSPERKPVPLRPFSRLAERRDDADVGGQGEPDEDTLVSEPSGAAGGRSMTDILLNQNTIWLKFKISILSWFSQKLRARVVKEVERRTQLELELLAQQAQYLQEMHDREVFFSTEVMDVLIQLMNRCLEESRRELKSLRGAMPSLYTNLTTMGLNSSTIAMGLQWWRDKRAAHVEVSTQSGDSVPSDWYIFVQSLPTKPTTSPLSTMAVADAIVRIYLRQLGTVADIPVMGGDRIDTAFDAVMAHYNSMKAPGLYTRNFLQDLSGPIARLFCSCRQQLGDTKVATFARFVGLGNDGIQWPMASWHHFLYILYCLRLLLGGTWKSTVKQWATPQGVQVPIQAVFDIVGNLFNVQTPVDLDGAVSRKLATLVLPGHAGPCVDLDALLLLLMTEHQSGNCPRSTLLFPRRLTDGSLFNIFNTAGYSPQITAILAPGARLKKAAEPAPQVSVATAKLLARAQAVVASSGNMSSPAASPHTQQLSPQDECSSHPESPSTSATAFPSGCSASGMESPKGVCTNTTSVVASAASPHRLAWTSPCVSRPSTASNWEGTVAAPGPSFTARAPSSSMVCEGRDGASYQTMDLLRPASPDPGFGSLPRAAQETRERSPSHSPVVWTGSTLPRQPRGLELLPPTSAPAELLVQITY